MVRVRLVVVGRVLVGLVVVGRALVVWALVLVVVWMWMRCWSGRGRWTG